MPNRLQLEKAESNFIPCALENKLFGDLYDD